MKRSLSQIVISGTIAALFGGGVAFSPAVADDAPSETAPVDEVGYEQFVQRLIAADTAISAVGQDGEGNIVVSAEAGTLSRSTVQALEVYGNVVVKDRGPVQALAGSDVVGGAGYAINRKSLCSFGFSAWSSKGTPAIVSAGHCGKAGDTVQRTVPSRDDAPLFPEDSSSSPSVLDVVGVFGFSQWGGRGGSGGSQGDLSSTDISAIDVTNTALTLRPRVTDWKSWQGEDLSVSAIPVTALGTVRVNDVITRSGRTSGSHGGRVVEARSWARICEKVQPVPTGCHWVYGFWTDAISRPGDSGGPFLRGTTAVGLLSGGNGEESFASDLVTGLAQTPGYSIMLDLPEPVTTTPEGAQVEPGSAIRGTGPAGLALEYAVGGGQRRTVAIGPDGSWSIPAPAVAGRVVLTLRVTDAPGFNVSDSVVLTVAVRGGGDPAVEPSVAEWDPHAAYAAGDRVVHGDAVYEAVQVHQGHGDLGWILAPSLWKRVS